MTDTSGHAPTPTPLLDRHHALHAKIVDFAGWLMPIQYSGILEEHRAVRTGAGLFDLSHMGELVVEGPDAGTALARALVTDPPALAVGRAQYSMICAPDGGIIDDLIVYRCAEDRYLVVANASNAREVSDALAERLDGSSAILDDRSLATGLVAIQGPRSVEILQPLVDVDLGTIRYYGIADGHVAGIPAQIARTGYTGEDGFEIYVRNSRALELWDRVFKAGEPLGIRPVGLGARDTLRLEMGYCLYGNDIDETTNPLEAGLAWTVRPEKSEFLGRDAIAKIREAGPARRLLGLVLDGARIARPGFDVELQGQSVGTVTSGSMGISIGRPVAMAYLDAGTVRPGTHVDVVARGQRIPAMVAGRPMYTQGSVRSPKPRKPQ
jgi:aminomethyltransferase